MTKQAIRLLLLCGILAGACGCNVVRAILYDPFGPNTLCDGRRCGMRGCGEACGPVCEEPCGPGPLRGRCGVGGAVAEPCDEGCCEECGGPTCCRPRLGILRGPLSLIFALFSAGPCPGCGPGEPCSGCGERYWGDWYGDPPECCDPCDCYGNFTGGGCSSCGGRGVNAPAGMAGQYEDGGTAPQPGGCRSCGQGATSLQSYGSQRYSSQYAARTQRYPAQYASGIQGYPTQYVPGTQGYPTQNATGTQGYRTQYSARAQGYPTQYAARTQRNSSQSPSGPYSSGAYAPRLISTTDRVVKPATAEQLPHLAQPLQAGTTVE